MPLTLTVDELGWFSHLRAVASGNPGLVPVAKGNGYGFGVERLARVATDLGVDTLAVGTYDEVPAARKAFAGTLLVLAPWRPFLHHTGDDPELVHSVGRAEDLAALARSAPHPRVVLEGMTAMRRHGLSLADATGLDTATVRLEGLALHLAPDRDRVEQVEPWLAAGLAPRLYVSYLAPAELAGLRARYPGVEIRARVGTALWLGARPALTVSSTVLDVHPLRRGDRVGYRQRRTQRAGHLLVLAGGTAHGIGLTGPSAARSIRDRAAATAKGTLESAGMSLSPFVVAGRQRWFVEPPHMQVSLVFLPADLTPPPVGSDVPVEARFTTTRFDRVLTTTGAPLS